jgi:hypothetical protein
VTYLTAYNDQLECRIQCGNFVEQRFERMPEKAVLCASLSEYKTMSTTMSTNMQMTGESAALVNGASGGRNPLLDDSGSSEADADSLNLVPSILSHTQDRPSAASPAADDSGNNHSNIFKLAESYQRTVPIQSASERSQLPASEQQDQDSIEAVSGRQASSVQHQNRQDPFQMPTRAAESGNPLTSEAEDSSRTEAEASISHMAGGVGRYHATAPATATAERATEDHEAADDASDLASTRIGASASAPEPDEGQQRVAASPTLYPAHAASHGQQAHSQWRQTTGESIAGVSGDEDETYSRVQGAGSAFVSGARSNGGGVMRASSMEQIHQHADGRSSAEGGSVRTAGDAQLDLRCVQHPLSQFLKKNQLFFLWKEQPLNQTPCKHTLSVATPCCDSKHNWHMCDSSSSPPK